MKKILKAALKKVLQIDALAKNVRDGLKENLKAVQVQVQGHASALAAIEQAKSPEMIRAKRALYEWCYKFQVFAARAMQLDIDPRKRKFQSLGVTSHFSVGKGKKAHNLAASNVKQLIAWTLGIDYRETKATDPEVNRIKAVQWGVLRHARAFAAQYPKTAKALPLPKSRVTVERSPVRVVVDKKTVGFLSNSSEHINVLAGVFPAGEVKSALTTLSRRIAADEKVAAERAEQKKVEAAKAGSAEAIRASA